MGSKWNEVKTLVPQRDQTLQDELKKQENNEALRRSFAEKANQVGPWIERQMDAVAAIGMGMQGSLEEQLSRLREYEEAVYQFKPHLEELERITSRSRRASYSRTDTLSTPWRPSESAGSSWSPLSTGQSTRWRTRSSPGTARESLRNS